MAVQINGTPPCPIWAKVARNHETVWLDCSPHQPPSPDPLACSPDLVVVQCAARWWDLKALGWDRLHCPKIASCGDASVLCNLDMVFRNLDVLDRLYVEGHDYVEKYLEWCRTRGVRPTPEKLRFQKLFQSSPSRREGLRLVLPWSDLPGLRRAPEALQAGARPGPPGR